MVSKELLDYIKSVKEKGFQDDAVKAHLLKYNYSSEVIDQAFKELSFSAPSETTNVAAQQKSKGIKKNNLKDILTYLLFFMIFVTIIGTLLYFFGGNLSTFYLYSSLEICEDVSIKVHEIYNEPVICVFPDNSKVQLILENNGKRIINKAEILVKGEKNTTTDNLNNFNLVSNDVFTRVINYDYGNGGSISEITIIPIILRNSKERKCNAQKIIYKDIKTS